MEATDGSRVGAAGGGRQLLSAPADVPVALFLPAEPSFQPGSRRRTVSVPRAQRAAAGPAETSGAPHPHPRTPGRQRAAPAAAPAGRRPPARRAASVKRPLASPGLCVGPFRLPFGGRGVSTPLPRGPLAGPPWSPSQRPPKGPMPSLLRPGPGLSLPNPPRRAPSRPRHQGATSTRRMYIQDPRPLASFPKAPPCTSLGAGGGRPRRCTRSRSPSPCSRCTPSPLPAPQQAEGSGEPSSERPGCGRAVHKVCKVYMKLFIRDP